MPDRRQTRPSEHVLGADLHRGDSHCLVDFRVPHHDRLVVKQANLSQRIERRTPLLDVEKNRIEMLGGRVLHFAQTRRVQQLEPVSVPSPQFAAELVDARLFGFDDEYAEALSHVRVRQLW